MSNTEKVLRAKIQAVDNFTKPMQKVISQTKTFKAVAKAVKPIVLKVKDMASKIINKVKAQVDKFKATKFGQFMLKAKDMATKVSCFKFIYLSLYFIDNFSSHIFYF